MKTSKYSAKPTLLAFSSLGVLLFLVSAKAQVFTPFFTGNNPPLVDPRPPVINKVEINGVDLTSTLDGFYTQTGEVWYEWEPTGSAE